MMDARDEAREAAIDDWPIKGAPITDAMRAAFDAGWDARESEVERLREALTELVRLMALSTME
jgi:hypothetical protein